jgi:hypothetical protein
MTYEPKTMTVAVILVHEENDDVQEIPQNKGKPNTEAINTGPDGICNSTSGGDDVQVIQPGKGLANQTCITAGADGILTSAPAGDDIKVGSTITTGADGICNTAKAGDDVQVIPTGKGKPNVVAITTGPDGVSNTDKGGDDVQLIAKTKGLPNQVCVKAGVNTKRDTKPAGDDTVVGEEVTTGPDGVCNTAANATNLMSTDLPSHAALIDYLNKTAYNQAVLSWNVTFLPAKTVNFDLDLDGQVDVLSWMTAEMREIRDNCKDDTYDRNIFLVDNPNDGSLGFMEFNQRYGFVHVGGTVGSATLNPNHIVAHELGHGGFSLRHPFEQGQPAVDTDNLMTWFANGAPWRFRKPQWDLINP